MVGPARSQTMARAALAAGALLRAWLAMRDLTALDDLFVPDDTYYTLAIAREIAAGHGPTADGVTLTNGFQPLTAFLLAAVFGLGATDDGALRAALVLSALADVATLFGLAWLARRALGPAAGAVAAAAWALSPLAVACALNGLESTLSVALVTTALCLWSRERETPAAWRRVLLGGVWGLAVLARIDAALAALLFAAVCAREKNARLLVSTSAVAFLVVAPWWAYELRHFGTIVPESGAAVREIAGIHRAMYLDTRRQIAWAEGTLAGAPFVMWPWLRRQLFDSAALTVLAVTASVGVVGAAWRRTRAAMDAVGGAAVRVLAAWGLAVLSLYVFYVPAVWFFGRYLLPCIASLTVVFAGAFGSLLAGSSSRGRAIGGALVGALLACGAVVCLRACVASPGMTDAQGLEGARGYRRAAREALAIVPPGAVVGSLQSGALSYFGRGRVQVVNLDGVVDREAAAAFASGTLLDYARRRGVTHLVDWPFNMEVLAKRGGERARVVRKTRIGAASPQGEADVMEVWALDEGVPGAGTR